MESLLPENLAIDRKKLIDELIRGREFATQLQCLLDKPHGAHGSESAEDLVVKILRSFTETLSTLTSSESGEVRQNPETTHVSPPCCDDRSSEDSGESRKSPALKERRGSYKRRKISQTWTRFNPTPISEDGHAWRKYGQKEILNAKYPRSYFRCTYKIDQGCQATKQVQRTEDDPMMYRITYMGHHTCKDMLKAPQLILVSSPSSESYILNFESNIPSKQDLLSSSFPSTKWEVKEEIPSELTHNHSSPDYLLSSDLTAFETSGPTTVLSSTPESDQGDVISGVDSCTTSSYNLDMSLNVGCIDFDDMFHFDEDGFF